MLLLAEEEALEEEAEGGVLPHSVAETMMDEIAVRRQALKGMGVARLRIEPTELLSKVPFFTRFRKASSRSLPRACVLVPCLPTKRSWNRESREVRCS